VPESELPRRHCRKQALDADARRLGQDPRSEDFLYRIALGMLAVGIEYGRSTPAESSTLSTP